jgi:hypothetical protein
MVAASRWLAVMQYARAAVHARNFHHHRLPRRACRVEILAAEPRRDAAGIACSLAHIVLKSGD